MNKKAQASTMTLEEMMKYLLGFVMFLMIISFLGVLYAAYTSKAPSTYENDFQRVKQDIISLDVKQADIIIPIFTKNIEFTFGYELKLNSCQEKKYCLCYNYKSAQKCEALDLDSAIFTEGKDQIPQKAKVSTNSLKLSLQNGAISLSLLI